MTENKPYKVGIRDTIAFWIMSFGAQVATPTYRAYLTVNNRLGHAAIDEQVQKWKEEDGVDK